MIDFNVLDTERRLHHRATRIVCWPHHKQAVVFALHVPKARLAQLSRASPRFALWGAKNVRTSAGNFSPPPLPSPLLSYQNTVDVHIATAPHKLEAQQDGLGGVCRGGKLKRAVGLQRVAQHKARAGRLAHQRLLRAHLRLYNIGCQ